MKLKWKFLALFMSFCVLSGLFPAVSLADAVQPPKEHTLSLESEMVRDGIYTHRAVLDGNEVREFDYVWHADPAEEHDEIKDAPAEYYTGEKPPADEAVYVAHDIFYYPRLPSSGFSQVFYDDEWEWACYYPEGPYHDYIFATLPIQGPEIPEQMMHSPEEAYQNAVLHITQPGVYRLSGKWHGQIWVDLGDSDDTFADANAKVTLVFENVEITCTAAPAVVFYSAYECDNGWETRESHTAAADTSSAGANIVIADDSVNRLTGTNVYRMLKTAYKSDSASRWGDVKVQKKKRKIDGALYSFVSMNLDGEEKKNGVLSIHAGFEGLDSELHLTINGANIHIYSQDDGINVNEDFVSTLTINGGSVHILAGLGQEGDGIDSNGYLVMNGGTLVTMANPRADSGMDSERGTFINGGTVVALGSTMDWAESAEAESSKGQAAMNLQFASAQSADEAIIITDTDGKIVFAYDPDKDEVAGNNARWYQGAIISSSEIMVGGSYHVYVGGDITGVESAGIYDISTVTEFTSDAKQQCYSSTGTFARSAPPPDGIGPGGPPPGGVEPGGMPPTVSRQNLRGISRFSNGSATLPRGWNGARRSASGRNIRARQQQRGTRF